MRIASFIRISVLFCWLVCCHSICRLLLLLLYHLRVILLSTASCFVSIKVVQNLLIIRLLLRIIYFLVLSTKWIDTTCIIIISIILLSWIFSKTLFGWCKNIHILIVRSCLLLIRRFDYRSGWRIITQRLALLATSWTFIKSFL